MTGPSMQHRGEGESADARRDQSAGATPATVITYDASEAAAYIRRGELAAFPTETVYGLGADATSPAAVRKIFDAKRRPSDNPLIVHLADTHQLPHVARRISSSARLLLERFSPGPITVIAERSEEIPPIVSGGLRTVGIRIPAHSLARSFLRACDTPVAAPSANISGRPSPTTWQAVRSDLEGRIGCILRGDRSPLGIESTVVDCTVDPPRVLRAGAISVEDIRDVVPGALTSLPDIDAGASPGTRYRHYAPQARVILVSPESVPSDPDGAYIGVSAPTATDLKLRRICDSTESYAHELYHFFREADRAGCRHIFCERVTREGIGRAVMDRIERAAAS